MCFININDITETQRRNTSIEKLVLKERKDITNICIISSLLSQHRNIKDKSAYVEESGIKTLKVQSYPTFQ